MHELDGKAIRVPQSRISERGMMLRSALEGKKPESKPKPDSIIEEMILMLARNLSEKVLK